MKKLTERQYEIFATLNRRLVAAIEQNGMGPFEDVDSLKKEWKIREATLGKECNEIAVSIAEYNYHRYFDALDQLNQSREKAANLKKEEKNKEHRQNILYRLTDMQNELTRIVSVISSDSANGLAIHRIEKVSAQATVLVKVIDEKTEIDNAQPTI